MKARLRPTDTAGSVVHTVLCDFFAKVPRKERTAEQLIDMFETRWAALSPRYLRIDGVKELHERKLSAVRGFAQREDLEASPFLVEASFQAQIAPDVTLFGRVDRIERAEKGRPLVYYQSTYSRIDNA